MLSLLLDKITPTNMIVLARTTSRRLVSVARPLRARISSPHASSSGGAGAVHGCGDVPCRGYIERDMRVRMLHSATRRRTFVPASVVRGDFHLLRTCSSSTGGTGITAEDTPPSPLSLTTITTTTSTTTDLPLPPQLGSVLPPAPIPGSEHSSLRNKGWWGRSLWDPFYSWERQRDRAYRVEAMFQAATRQGQDEQWYGPGLVGREFRPRHALLTLHIWLLHKRLLADQVDHEQALQIQEELFNVLWEDTISRIRQAGVPELMVNKNLLQVQQYTFLHLTHYDHCFTELLDKPEERWQELRRAIWQHIYVRDEQIQAHWSGHLDRLAWYIEANYQNIIMDWPDRFYREARVVWVDLPNFVKGSSNTTDRSGDAASLSPQLTLPPVHPDDVLPEPWLRNITVSGVYYYWNPITGQSIWDRPVAP